MLKIKGVHRQGLRLISAEPRSTGAESAATDVWDGPRVEVRLVYDTREQALPSGVRLVAQRARRVLFEGEGFELPIQIDAGRAAGRVAVMGQVLVNGAPVAQAAIRVEGPEPVAPTQTDAEGSFRLNEVQVGRYRLEIAAAGRILVTNPIELGGANRS